MRIRRNGFTMIELLVAIAILSILALMAASIISNASRARNEQLVYERMDASLNKATDVIKRVMRSCNILTTSQDAITIAGHPNADILYTTYPAIKTAGGTIAAEGPNVEILSVGEYSTSIRDRTVPNLVKINYNATEKIIYINDNLNDIIAENIDSVTYRKLDRRVNVGTMNQRGTVLLKMRIVMKMMVGGKWYTREITDAELSRVGINNQ